MSSSPIGKYLKTVFAKIVDNFLLTIAVPFATAAVIVGASRSDELTPLLHSVRNTDVLTIGFLLGTAVIVLVMRRPRAVYLIDYACFRPPNTHRVPSAAFVEHVQQVSQWTERSKRFLKRLYERSGLGEETCVPLVGHYIDPYKYSKFEDGREEAEMAVFSAIDELFSKTSIAPQAVDILVTNCSEFNPTPTFSDMIINRYKIRSDIHHVHLSSMGCSAGLISIELVKNLLQAAPFGANALVVSTETLSTNPYPGNERAMLLPFCLFRMGGAAVLLSTSPSMARFRLRCIMRTLTASSDQSYQCIYKEEDDKGYTGVNLSTELVAVAARTVKDNMTSIAPLVLPPSEKLLFAASFTARKLLNGRVKLYIPDFLSVFQHLCIHAGGRAVIDGVQRNFSLSDEKIEPSRMTLHRFGNTSSSSIWYELAYVEAKGRMDKGNQVWMIGFGSGFKCNSAVWECIRPVHDAHGPWADCIDRYPVHIP
ncbi:3-ketoacyl-CoA synthase 6-like [Miscanthus floridulus]|uniref:3-ketoacyl-CoA synthase 6-like n=1 Tax=Miscanthus floridulus TaxID=154761 RepID=UPI003458D7F6